MEQEQSDDYAIATGESYKLAELIEMAFRLVGLDWREYVATASVYECKLLTMDLDFGHLRDEFIDVVYITPSTFMS